jgi:2'-phosphotransferase
MEKTKSKGKINNSELTSLSKTMSFLLRHAAHEHNLPIESSGFVKLEDLLKNRKMKNMKATEEKVRAVVENDNKGRYELENRPPWYIRAVQGHSMSTVKDEDILDPITNIFEFPLIVHGTYMDAWELIKKSGLNKMSRNSIHFSIGFSKDDHVISGMRNDCNVMIEINGITAFYNGVKFFISKNKVVLTPGIDGVLPLEYFKKVIDRNGKILYQETPENCAFLDIDSETGILKTFYVVNLKDNSLIYKHTEQSKTLNVVAEFFISKELIKKPFIVVVPANTENIYLKQVENMTNSFGYLAFFIDYLVDNVGTKNLSEEEAVKHM